MNLVHFAAVLQFMIASRPAHLIATTLVFITIFSSANIVSIFMTINTYVDIPGICFCPFGRAQNSILQIGGAVL